jgi:hypothetical protein
VMADFLASDLPPLSLHVVSFTDATMVTLAWPHTLMDATGLSILVRNWGLVLAEREEEVGPLMGAHHDILHDAAGTEAAKEEEDRRDRDRMGPLQMLVFALYLLWSMLWDRIEPRLLYMPKEVMQKLRERSMAEIEEHGGKEGSDCWISEGDTALALWTRALAQSQAKPRPVIVLNYFEVRSRLPGIMTPQDNYIQNTMTPCTETISSALSRGPLGLIAQRLRKALVEATTPPQVLAKLRTQRLAWDAGGDIMALHGPPSAVLLATTNWGKARLFHVADFGPAVVRTGRGTVDGERINPPGTPCGFSTSMMRIGPTVRNALSQIGKDQAGDFWFMGMFTRSVWDHLQAMLDEL